MGKTSPPSLMVNRALVPGHHPPSPTVTSPPSLRLRSPPLLGPASREATQPLDHMYPRHSEMYSTKGHSAPQYNGVALPARIPRAGVRPQVHRPLNTVYLGLVSFIRAFSALELTLFLGPHYQILSPSEPYMYTPTSSRTGSSASLHPGTPSVAYLQPLSRSTSHSQSPKKMPSRPALKSNNTWTTSSVGSTCIPIFINSRKPDLLAPQILRLTHDLTLRSTKHPVSTCILSSPIHVSITHQSSTTWAEPRQPGLF